MDIYLNKKPDRIIDGISIFCQDTYWGKSSEWVLLDGIKAIDNSGWQIFDKQFAKKFDYSLDESLADWHFNIPISKTDLVLDIGAGLGRHSIPLSRFAGKVFAVDNSVSRMRFLKRFVEHKKIDNIEVVVADIFNLPFKKNSFDVIALNGVVEWLGKTNLFKDPRQAQVVAMGYCRELLRPGGYLYIGIENRFALSYLKGYDHSGLRYTSYMPRILANTYCRLRGRGPYDTYTYSKSGYIKLLTDAGFNKDSISFFLPYPGYNSPKIVIPYERLNILRYVIQVMMSSGGWKKKLVKKISNSDIFLFFYRKLFFSFNIIIKK